MHGGETMMNSKSNCIVCGGEVSEVVRNNLPMYLCAACGLFWRRSFELDEYHYEKRGFELENSDKINARYANSLERIETLRKYISLNNVCDVGCGEGIFLKALKDRGYVNGIGLEPSIKARDYASTNNLNIFEGDVESMSSSFFKEHNTHVVTMFHVIEHLRGPKEILKGIYDGLSEGDTLVIETPNTNSLVFTKTNFQNEFVYPEHLYYFNKNNLRTLLEGVGFKYLASGNRDFNENALGIKGALSRLGLSDFPVRGEERLESMQPKGAIEKENIKGGILKLIIRRLLSGIVKLCGRGNYLWIVVKK